MVLRSGLEVCCVVRTSFVVVSSSSSLNYKRNQKDCVRDFRLGERLRLRRDLMLMSRGVEKVRRELDMYPFNSNFTQLLSP